jgi:hypothetical protein
VLKAFTRYNLKTLRVYTSNKDICSCKSKGSCPTPGKHPAPWPNEPNKGVYNARVETEEALFEGYNIAVACGGESRLMIVDVDPRNGGHLTWHEICSGHKIPETLEVQTGGGGVHIYFIVPKDMNVRNLSFEGVDFQWEGKYCIAPPSKHPSGGSYVWTDCDPEETEIATIPQWLVEWLSKRVDMLDMAMVSSAYTHNIEPALHEWVFIKEILSKLSPDIGYNNWIGVGMGLHATGAEDAFSIWDNWSRQDGKKYKEGECAKKWASFGKSIRISDKRHTYKWIFAMAELYGISYGGELKNFILPVINETESIIADSGPLISQLAQYARACARVDKPEFALASALSVLSACVQGAWLGPAGLSLNLYQWCAGPAASGKDSYVKTTERIINEISKDLLSPRYNSVNGFRVHLMGYNSRLAIRDEFHDEYLQMVHTRNEYLKEVLKDYKILFNAPAELGSVLIKASMTPAVDHPYFSLLGFSTVSGLEACSQGDFLTSGMGSRFLFWVVGQSEEEKEPSGKGLEEGLLATLRGFIKQGLTMVGKEGEGASETIKRVQESFEQKKGKKQWVHLAQSMASVALGTTDEAQQEAARYSSLNRKQMMGQQDDDAIQSIIGRKSQLAMRLACLRCLSHERENVDKNDFLWGVRIVEANARVIQKFFSLNVGANRQDTEMEERAKRILRILRVASQAAGQPVLKKDLLKNKIMEPRQFDSALLLLIETGRVAAYESRQVDGRWVRIYPEKLQRGQRFRPSEEP